MTEWPESTKWTEATETYEAKRSEQAELAVGEAAEATPDGHSTPNPSSDGLAVFYVAEARQMPIEICHREDLTQ